MESLASKTLRQHRWARREEEHPVSRKRIHWRYQTQYANFCVKESLVSETTEGMNRLQLKQEISILISCDSYNMDHDCRKQTTCVSPMLSLDFLVIKISTKGIMYFSLKRTKGDNKRLFFTHSFVKNNSIIKALPLLSWPPWNKNPSWLITYWVHMRLRRRMDKSQHHYQRLCSLESLVVLRLWTRVSLLRKVLLFVVWSTQVLWGLQVLYITRSSTANSEIMNPYSLTQSAFLQRTFSRKALHRWWWIPSFRLCSGNTFFFAGKWYSPWNHEKEVRFALLKSKLSNWRRGSCRASMFLPKNGTSWPMK